MDLNQIKSKFNESMKYLYPDGLDWEKQKRQHKDLIQTFVMGWMDSLSVLLEHTSPEFQSYEFVKANLRDNLNYSKPITDENWWPDKSWRWA